MTRKPRRAVSARFRLTAVIVMVVVLFGAALLIAATALLAAQLPQQIQIAFTGELPEGTVPTDISSVAIRPSSSGEIPALSNTDSSGNVPSLDLTKYRTDTLRLLVIDGSIALIGVAILAGLASWILAGRILKPLRDIVASSRRISDQTLSERVPVGVANDELSELATTLNSMLDRIESGFQRERLLIAAAGHELHTPVANQRVLLEVAHADPDVDVEQLRQVGQIALEQNQRLERIINSVLALGHSRSSRQERTVSPTRLDQAVKDVLAGTDCGDLTVTTNLDPITLDTDPVLLERLLQNLITNAVVHNKPEGWITIDATHDQPEPKTNAAVITVTNSCHQIDPTLIPTLREPFRRGRADRTGSAASVGLGLTIIDAIAETNGWSMSISIPTTSTFAITITCPTPRA